MLAGARWPMAAPLRYLSYTIDTVLLTAALMLATMLHQYPFVHGWLTAKVLLLVVYVVLGSFALKRGAHAPRARAGASSRRSRCICFIVSVARAHDPRGVFALARTVLTRTHRTYVSTHCRGAPRYFTYTRAT